MGPIFFLKPQGRRPPRFSSPPKMDSLDINLPLCDLETTQEVEQRGFARQTSFSQSPHCVAANWPLITILKWRARDARAETFYRNNLMTYSKLSTINFRIISNQLSLMSRLLQLSSQPATVFEGTDTFCYSSHVKTYFSARVKFHSKEFKGPGWCESMNCRCM